MQYAFARSLRRCAAALATTLTAAVGCMSHAHAGYVVINADPLFAASPLVGYGWTATGALYLPEGCIGSVGDFGSSVTIPASSTGPCGSEAGLVLSDVSVRFYKASDLSTASIIILGTYLPLLEGATAAPPQRLGSVTYSTDETGAIDRVIGLNTTTSFTYTTTLPNLSGSGPALLDVEFTLDFNMFLPESEGPTIAGGTAGTSADIEGIGSWLTYTVTNLNPTFSALSFADKVTASDITADNPLAVPSPGTLALALLAGFAAWGERRRLLRRA